MEKKTKRHKAKTGKTLSPSKTSIKRHTYKASNANEALTSQRGGSKHHAKTRSPALLPVPKQLESMLRLANLVPVYLRQPNWAKRRAGEQRRVLLSRYIENCILTDWNPLATERGFTLLYLAISELPIELQAFVLQGLDDEAYLNKGKSIQAPTNIETKMDFGVLDKTESELLEIIQDARERHRQALGYEEAKEQGLGYEVSKGPITIRDALFPEVESNGDSYSLIEPRRLYNQAHQRLVFIIAVQETLICLTHPQAWRQVLEGRKVSRLYDSESKLYIIQQGKDEGKLGLLTSPLYEPLLGVEASRIRECPICYKIFWAGRRDQVGCSPQCSKVVRTRRWRENATRYELARAEKERASMTKSNQKKKGR
jgi:hypothetical protein